MLRLSAIFLVYLLLNNFFLVNKNFAEEIPVIVISAGKVPQSKSTIGSDVSIIDSNSLAESNE